MNKVTMAKMNKMSMANCILPVTPALSSASSLSSSQQPVHPSTMTDGQIKHELITLGDPSFVFTDRSSLEATLKAARRANLANLSTGRRPTSAPPPPMRARSPAPAIPTVDDGTGTVGSDGGSGERGRGRSIKKRFGSRRRSSSVDCGRSNKISGIQTGAKAPIPAKIIAEYRDESVRLVEYFVMVSCRAKTNCNTRGKNPKNTKESPLSNSLRTPMSCPTGALSRLESRRVHLPSMRTGTSTRQTDLLDTCPLEPVVTARYPEKDHPNQPLNTMLPQFCHPGGTDFLYPTSQYRMPHVHYFVLTDSKGGRLYGTCLTVYEEYTVPETQTRERKLNESENENENETPENENDKTKQCYYAPRVLCLLSTWPYLAAFRTYLTQLYRLATATNLMTAPIERYISNICSEVPAPPPGAFEVRVSILDSAIRFCPPPAHQPIPYVSLRFGALFECLDIGNILYVWYNLACERKVLLVSDQLSLLTVCAEILCSILFPMRWSHLYIPVLPSCLTPMLDAPMPYLCGISRENFEYAIPDVGDETVVVDLDRNVITLGDKLPELPPLPHKRRMKLQSALERNAGDVFWNARNLTSAEVSAVKNTGTDDESDALHRRADAVWQERIGTADEAFNLAYAPDSANLVREDDAAKDVSDGGLVKQSRWDAVQEAFLRFYVSILKDYRKYLPLEAFDVAETSWRGKNGNAEPRFRTEEFITAQRPDFQPFLEELTSTQQFDDFITKRIYNAGNEPDVIFFDQSIDAKRNRSKLILKKKDVSFLHSSGAHKDLQQVDAIEPDHQNLPPPKDGQATGIGANGQRVYLYPTWPESFDGEAFGTPRPIPRVIVAEFDRRIALKSNIKARMKVLERELRAMRQKEDCSTVSSSTCLSQLDASERTMKETFGL